MAKILNTSRDMANIPKTFRDMVLETDTSVKKNIDLLIHHIKFCVLRICEKRNCNENRI